MGKTFISYSSNDSATASQLCAILEKNGVRCWIAPRDIVPGQDYAGLITRAVRDADAFILILSESSYRSAHVLNELSLAFDRGLNIIPYCIDSSDPGDAFSYYLATKHRINSVGNIRQDVDSILQALGHNDIPTRQEYSAPKKARIWWVAAALMLCATLPFAIRSLSAPDDGEGVDEPTSMPAAEDITITQADQKEVTPAVIDMKNETADITKVKESSVPTTRAEDGFEATLTIQPSGLSVDSDALKEIEDGIFLHDRGRYMSYNVRYQTYFRKEGEQMIALVDSDHPTESVKTLLTCADAGSGIRMKITQHKYGFKTEVFEKDLGVVIASCMAKGCKPYVGIDSSDGSKTVASLFMVNPKEGYTHIFKVSIPEDILKERQGLISADLNAYSPLTDSDSMFQDP